MVSHSLHITAAIVGEADPFYLLERVHMMSSAESRGSLVRMFLSQTGLGIQLCEQWREEEHLFKCMILTVGTIQNKDADWLVLVYVYTFKY